MFCVARFSQGLRLRQVDMMADGIAGSSATLLKMAKKIREVCITAMEKLRRRKAQRPGGPREFVRIDESHFRHKRKVCSFLNTNNLLSFLNITGIHWNNIYTIWTKVLGHLHITPTGAFMNPILNP